MFWETQLIDSATLGDLLKKDNITLAEVLADDYTLQECKNGNNDLIAFLTRPEIVDELVTNTLAPIIDESLPKKDQYRFSHLSCELLTTNSDELSKAILLSNHARTLISQFFHSSHRLNPLVASFYARAISQLVSRRTHETLELLRSGPFLDDAFRHMDASAVMDLLYRLINLPCEQDDSDIVKQWYVDENIGGRLVELFTIAHINDVHSNASYLWSETVRMLRECQYTAETKRNDVLLDHLQSVQLLRLLFVKMFIENVDRNESIIINACSIFVALLQTNLQTNSPEQLVLSANGEIQSTWFGGTVSNDNESSSSNWSPDPEHQVELIICEHLPIICSYLFECSTNQLKQQSSFGLARVTLVKLIVLLLNTNHLPTHVSLVSVDLLKRLTRLVYEYPLNSLLHLSTMQCIQFILFSRISDVTIISPLIRHLLVECSLIDMIIDKANENFAVTLSRIAKVQLRAYTMNVAHWLELARMRSSNKHAINTIMDEIGMSEQWSSFVETILFAYNTANEADNVDAPSSSSTTTIMDEGEIPIDSNTSQQLFSDYLMQHAIVNTMPERFGLPMETFTSTSDSSLSAPTANLFAFDAKQEFDDTPPGEAAFEALCASRIAGSELTERRSTTHTVDPFEFADRGDDAWPTSASGGGTTIPSRDSNEFAINWTESTSSTVPTQTSVTSKCKASTDDWPSDATTSSSNVDDSAWADFGSSKTRSLPTSDINSSTAMLMMGDVASPVCAGIASSLANNDSNVSIVHSKGKQSELPTQQSLG